MQLTKRMYIIYSGVWQKSERFLGKSVVMFPTSSKFLQVLTAPPTTAAFSVLNR